jgi:Mycothiol maleylpyruvate isomerase N-terminal domain
MELSTVVPAFLSAARFAGDVLRDPQVGAAWDHPSALPRMTVGEIAGHLFLIVRRVDKRLDAPAAVAGPRLDGMMYPRVDRPEDLDEEIHEQVRRDGRHVAAWGWNGVCESFDARVAKLEGRMPSDVPADTAMGDHVLAFGDYLGSRVVEVVVHTDDIVVSVGADVGEPPADAVDTALLYLLGAARRVHGDGAVLDAFTRRERAPVGAPSVF